MPPFNVMSSSFRPKWVQVMLSVRTQVWDHSPEHWQTIRSLTPEKSMSFLSPPAAVNCHNPSPGDMTLWVFLLSMPECWLTGSCTALMQVITVAMNLWDQWFFISRRHYFTESFHYQSFSSTSHDGPWAIQGGDDIDVSLRAEHSMIFFSLQVDQLSVSIFITICYKK